MFYAQNMMPNNPYMTRDPGRSYIRILHAAPNAPAVDVYANGKLIANNISYKQFTEYMPVPSGNYRILIYPAGNKDKPVLTTTATLPANSIFTIAAIGLLPDISLLPIAEQKIMLPQTMAAVRFSHLSPTAPNLDITLPDGTVVFSDVRYKETTSYIMVPPSTYRMLARIAGTDKVILDVPNIRIMPNRYYTVYAVGLPGEEPPLQALIPLDGPSYLPI